MSKTIEELRSEKKAAWAAYRVALRLREENEAAVKKAWAKVEKATIAHGESALKGGAS